VLKSSVAHPPEVRKEARRLRTQGASYVDIMNKLGLSKSTVKYMVRDVQLTRQQRAALKSRRPKQALTEDGRERIRKASSLYSKRRWETSRDRQLIVVNKNRRKANLAYRDDELPIKAALEALFNRQFRKEEINGRIIDFACNDLIVEHSSDFTKGINDMIARFADVSTDSRRKIAFVNTRRFGDRRRARLASVVDEIRSHKELESTYRE